jgi:hypothetical protein
MTEVARSTWLSHLVATEVFRSVASTLGAHSIPVLPIKGLLTAHLLYDDISQRPIRDIDIRLRRRDFERAERLGRNQGWHAEDVALLGQVLWRVDGIEVDVKSALGPPGLCALSTDEVFARAEQRTAPFGFPHLEPEWNDHALMLVLNVFKDGMRSTPWAIEDLRRIVEHPPFDPVVLVDRARAGQVLTALWIVSDWMARTQGAPAWRNVRDRIGPRAPSPRAAGTYALWQRLGCPRRVGHFVVPTVTDDARRALAGLGQATAGLARGYGLRALSLLRPPRVGKGAD